MDTVSSSSGTGRLLVDTVSSSSGTGRLLVDTVSSASGITIALLDTVSAKSIISALFSEMLFTGSTGGCSGSAGGWGCTGSGSDTKMASPLWGIFSQSPEDGFTSSSRNICSASPSSDNSLIFIVTLSSSACTSSCLTCHSSIWSFS